MPQSYAPRKRGGYEVPSLVLDGPLLTNSPSAAVIPLHPNLCNMTYRQVNLKFGYQEHYMMRMESEEEEKLRSLFVRFAWIKSMFVQVPHQSPPDSGSDTRTTNQPPFYVNEQQFQSPQLEVD